MSSLQGDPFEFSVTGDGRVRISRGGKVVVTVAGVAAGKLTDRLGGSPEADQQLLARATGNYKRGNERRSR